MLFVGNLNSTVTYITFIVEFKKFIWNSIWIEDIILLDNEAIE